jgi:hypothetical protein
MGREITHAVPPKFPDSSQRTGFASHLRPSINARITLLAYCCSLLIVIPTIESSQLAHKQFLLDHIPKQVQSGFQLPPAL